VSENRVLGRIRGPKRDEVTGEWRKLHSKKFHNLYASPTMRMKWERACSRNGGGEKSVRGFGGKARRKQNTRKTEEQIGGWDQNGP
jgi:hypothetical protein